MAGSLNERFGSMPLAEVIQPAIDLAEYGFPASPLLVGAVRQLDSRGAEALHELSSQATSVGAVVRRQVSREHSEQWHRRT